MQTSTLDNECRESPAANYRSTSQQKLELQRMMLQPRKYAGLAIIIFSLIVGFLLGHSSNSLFNTYPCSSLQLPTVKVRSNKVDEMLSGNKANTKANSNNATTRATWSSKSNEIVSVAKSNTNADKNDTTATACQCPDRLYTKGQWKQEQWLVKDPKHCFLQPLDVSAFCNVLGNRSILVAGDSINGQLYRLLFELLHGIYPADATVHLHQRFGKEARPVHYSGKICNGSSLTFIRNDYLRLDQTLEDTVTAKAFLIPWLHLIPSHEVLILNSGVHVPPGEIDYYTKNMKQLRVYLEKTIKYPGKVIFRTSPRGHPDCSTDDRPITSTNSSEWKRFFETTSNHPQYTRYQWQLMPSFNQVMIQEMESFASVLDVATMTELRPDNHAHPPKDCLHYNQNSHVYHEWIRLIFNELLGNLC